MLSGRRGMAREEEAWEEAHQVSTAGGFFCHWNRETAIFRLIGITPLLSSHNPEKLKRFCCTFCHVANSPENPSRPGAGYFGDGHECVPGHQAGQETAL